LPQPQRVTLIFKFLKTKVTLGLMLKSPKYKKSRFLKAGFVLFYLFFNAIKLPRDILANNNQEKVGVIFIY